ncbi:tetratricopeptide repeat protein [Streptomyces sp. Go40/10]|nr:tetratricopeptide repeat protein [Streptomyces sp. Go40/10]UFR07360.1 tetratricopeptide repeat protein [Streptomyces sp. Go40/10]
MLIFAVTGMGGIGKTALAVEAAHRARAQGWFPGGTLFVDLRGYDDDPVTADQAVLALLDALGVRDRDLPATTERQYDAYRALLADRRDRMLLVLDNASDPSQYVPLLPGTDRHRVLITSRDRPDALPVRLIDLGILAPDDSVALVTRALAHTDERDDRLAREPEALQELCDLCGHLPLALQIAAGMLRRRRHRDVASLVAEIKKAEDPTAALDRGSPGTDLYGRSLVLRPVLETSYRRLTADQARLLRLLCLAPSAETSTEAVAALADLETDDALPLLEDLAAVYLVSAVRSVGGPGSGVRWRVHDLVRAFGAGVVARDAELREAGEAARERIVLFYIGRAVAADALLSGLRGVQEPFADRVQAVAWLDEERVGLVAAVQWAREERFAGTAAMLADCLTQYLRWRRLFDDSIAVAEAAREAAHRAGDRHREAGVLNNLGKALAETGRTDEAIDAYTRARDLFQAIGDRHQEAGAWSHIGDAMERAGRSRKAITAHTRARDLFQAIGDRRCEARVWGNLGVALRDAGRTKKAIDAHTHARRLFQAIGDRLGEAMAWGNLGNAHQRAGHPDKAIHAHTVARSLFEGAGDRYGEATEWGNVANALQQAGRMEEAIEAYGKSLEIFREFKDWYGQGVTLHNLADAHRAAHQHGPARSAYLQATDAYARANAPTEAAQARARATEPPD